MDGDGGGETLTEAELAERREQFKAMTGLNEAEFKRLERMAMDRLQARLSRSLDEFDRFTKGEKSGAVGPGRDH